MKQEEVTRPGKGYVEKGLCQKDKFVVPSDFDSNFLSNTCQFFLKSRLLLLPTFKNILKAKPVKANSPARLPGGFVVPPSCPPLHAPDPGVDVLAGNFPNPFFGREKGSCVFLVHFNTEFVLIALFV